MSAYEADRVKKAAYAGLMLKEIAQKLGRSITTIWYWLQKLNVHQVWSIARRMIMYKVMRVGHRKTYLQGEGDRMINSVKLEYRFNHHPGKEIDPNAPFKPNPRLSQFMLETAFNAKKRNDSPMNLRSAAYVGKV